MRLRAVLLLPTDVVVQQLLKLLFSSQRGGSLFLLFGPLVNLLVKVVVDLDSKPLIGQLHADVVKLVQKVGLVDPRLVARQYLPPVPE